MLEGIDKVRNPAERRRIIEGELHRGYLMTDVLLLSQALSVEVQEIILGIIKDSAGTPTKTGMGRHDAIQLQTVSGQPMGGVKVGVQPYSLTTRKLSEMETRGESPDVVVEYGTDFDVDPERAILLLSLHGYGIVKRRFRRRLSRARGEKNSHGRAIQPIDEWRLVERGSRFATQAAHELVARARGEHQDFEPVDRAEARRLLGRALELAPGLSLAQAALAELADEPGGARKGKAA